MASNDDVVVVLVFQRLAAEWRLTPDEAAAIAGLRTETYRRWLGKRPTRPSQETLARLNLAIEINLRAHALFRDVPGWARKRSAALKGAPLALMMKDGQAGLEAVHAFLTHLARDHTLTRR